MRGVGRLQLPGCAAHVLPLPTPLAAKEVAKAKGRGASVSLPFSLQRWLSLQRCLSLQHCFSLQHTYLEPPHIHTPKEVVLAAGEHQDATAVEKMGLPVMGLAGPRHHSATAMTQVSFHVSNTHLAPMSTEVMPP